MDDFAVVGFKGLKDEFGIVDSRTTIWRKMKAGVFPRIINPKKHRSTLIRSWLPERHTRALSKVLESASIDAAPCKGGGRAGSNPVSFPYWSLGKWHFGIGQVLSLLRSSPDLSQPAM